MGRLIVVEGLDGSGKSTQFERLLQTLSGRQIAAKGISFPDYGEPSSALVKMYLNGEFGDSPDSVNAYAASAFYAVDRYASFKRHWEPAYRKGTLIVAARYVTSNAVHQMTKLPRAEWDAYLGWLCDFEYEKLGLPRPDAVLYLDMPVEVSQKLLAGRYGGDQSRRDVHERDIRYLKSCRESAEYAAQKMGWTVIPCAENGEALSIEKVHQKVLDALESILPAGGSQ